MGLTKPRAAQIFNLDYKQSTRVVTATNINLSGGAPSVIDGVNLVKGDRILVTGQTTGSQNGLYLVTTLGSGSNGTWDRTSDGNENGEIEAGMIVMVTEGAIYADTQWKLITDDPIVINTTALTFTQNYMANSISGGTSNVVVYSNSDVTISSAGTANVFTVSNTGVAVLGTISTTGNITGNYILGNGSQLTGLPATYSNANVASFLVAFGSNTISTSGTVTAGNITGSNILTSGLVSATGNVIGNYILGNGVSLTGVITSVANINNGTSNVTVVSSGGNVTVGVGGTGNIAVFSTSGLDITGQVSTTGNITSGNISATNHTGTNVSVTGTVTTASTVGGVITGTSTSVTGTQTAASTVGGVITGTSTSVSGGVTANSVAATSNGAGTNFRVGDDVWIGDINIADTMSIRGQQSALNGYIVFGNADSTALGRAGSGPLTYGGAFSASGNVTAGNVQTGGLISATGNITGGNILGNGAGLSGINVFSNVTVTGGNSAVADSISDTLTLTAGTGIAIVVDSATDTITIAASGGSEIFVDGADFGTVTEPVTLSDDLGLVTDAVTEEADLGTLVTAGLIYPDQFVLPSYTANTLPSAAVAGAMIYVTNETGGPVPAFADGTNWRRVTDRAIVT
jgi:fibronectin-binding autotransporter adhesin